MKITGMLLLAVALFFAAIGYSVHDPLPTCFAVVVAFAGGGMYFRRRVF